MPRQTQDQKYRHLLDAHQTEIDEIAAVLARALGYPPDVEPPVPVLLAHEAARRIAELESRLGD